MLRFHQRFKRISKCQCDLLFGCPTVPLSSILLWPSHLSTVVSVYMVFISRVMLTEECSGRFRASSGGEDSKRKLLTRAQDRALVGIEGTKED